MIYPRTEVEQCATHTLPIVTQIQYINNTTSSSKLPTKTIMAHSTDIRNQDVSTIANLLLTSPAYNHHNLKWRLTMALHALDYTEVSIEPIPDADGFIVTVEGATWLLIVGRAKLWERNYCLYTGFQRVYEQYPSISHVVKVDSLLDWRIAATAHNEPTDGNEPSYHIESGWWVQLSTMQPELLDLT